MYYTLSDGWGSTPASNAYKCFDLWLVIHLSEPQFRISQMEIKLVPDS